MQTAVSDRRVGLGTTRRSSGVEASSPTECLRKELDPDLQEFLKILNGPDASTPIQIGDLQTRASVAADLQSGKTPAAHPTIVADLRRICQRDGISIATLADQLKGSYTEQLEFLKGVGRVRTQCAEAPHLSGHYERMELEAQRIRSQDQSSRALAALADKLGAPEREIAMALIAIKEYQRAHPEDPIVKSDIVALVLAEKYGVVRGAMTQVLHKGITGQEYERIQDANESVKISLQKAVRTASDATKAALAPWLSDVSGLYLVTSNDQVETPCFLFSGEKNGIVVLPIDPLPFHAGSPLERLGAVTAHEAGHLYLGAFGRCHSLTLTEAITTSLTLALFPKTEIAQFHRGSSDDLMRVVLSGQALGLSASANISMAQVHRGRETPPAKELHYPFGHLLVAYLASRYPKEAGGLALDAYRAACQSELAHPEDPSHLLIAGGVRQSWASERDIIHAALKQAFGDHGLRWNLIEFTEDMTQFVIELAKGAGDQGTFDSRLAKHCQRLYQAA